MGILEAFSRKKIDLSYKEEVRKEILMSGITRYYHLVLLDLVGRRSLHRSAEEMKSGRELKPLKTRAWYISQRGGTKVALKKEHPDVSVRICRHEAGGRSGKPGEKNQLICVLCLNSEPKTNRLWSYRGR